MSTTTITPDLIAGIIGTLDAIPGEEEPRQLLVQFLSQHGDALVGLGVEQFMGELRSFERDGRIAGLEAVAPHIDVGSLLLLLEGNADDLRLWQDEEVKRIASVQAVWRAVGRAGIRLLVAAISAA